MVREIQLGLAGWYIQEENKIPGLHLQRVSLGLPSIFKYSQGISFSPELRSSHFFHQRPGP